MTSAPVFHSERRRPPVQGLRHGGFTLIELVMVMLITGIIAAVVAIFIQKPVQGYFDTVRRAQLSDAADLALRRMARDVQTALPNSVRSTDANNYFLEFIPVSAGGRYRASGDGSTNPLDISNAADVSFDVLGPAVTIAASQSVVIYNTGQTGANAYAGDNLRSATAGTNLSTVTFSGSQFPRHSPSYIFQVVSSPVTYACDATNGVLWRFSGYTLQSAQPVTLSSGQLVTLSGNIAGSRLATNVVCASSVADLGTGFEVNNAAGLANPDGVVGMRIHLRDSTPEEVRLYRELHVDNTP